MKAKRQDAILLISSFTHISGKYMEFSDPMPEDMREVMNALSAGVQ